MEDRQSPQMTERPPEVWLSVGRQSVEGGHYNWQDSEGATTSDILSSLSKLSDTIRVTILFLISSMYLCLVLTVLVGSLFRDDDEFNFWFSKLLSRFRHYKQIANSEN